MNIKMADRYKFPLTVEEAEKDVCLSPRLRRNHIKHIERTNMYARQYIGKIRKCPRPSTLCRGTIKLNASSHYLVLDVAFIRRDEIRPVWGSRGKICMEIKLMEIETNHIGTIIVGEYASLKPGIPHGKILEACFGKLLVKVGKQ